MDRHRKSLCVAVGVCGALILGVALQSALGTSPQVQVESRAVEAPAPAIVPGAKIVDLLARDESAGERLDAAVHLGARVQPLDGSPHPARVLDYVLRLQRRPTEGGATFVFHDQILVRAAGTEVVRTSRMGGREADGARYTYGYEIRPRSGLTWEQVGAITDLELVLSRN